MAAKIDSIEAFENSLKELYCVSNSGECGYFVETMYYTRRKDAFDKVAYWLNIGDYATVSTINVMPEAYKTIQAEFGGRINSADYYEMVSEYSLKEVL